MIRGFDQATLEIETDVAAEISWLTPPRERHFEPATVVVALAGVLLSGFLAGFTAEAKKAGEEAGKAAFRRLEAIVKSLFARTESPDKVDLNRLATEAPGLAANATPNDLQLYATHSEDMLRAWLEINMPRDRAAALATKIREVAVRQILIAR